MSWIAQAGRPIGKTGVRTGHHGGGGGGNHSDDEVMWAFRGGLPTFQGVPFCGPAMCGWKGMPPRPLPQPGIRCVNRDRPCLPCDIINLQLRTSVTGVKMKRAVADAQKRYFCSVWNLLFSYMFPDHVPAKCPNLKAHDLESICRSSKAAKKRRAAPPKNPRLPYGIVPRRSIGPLQDRKMEDRPPPPPPPPPPPTPPPPRFAHLRTRGADRGGNLRYNIWTMPMPDASKENKNPGAQLSAKKQASNSNAYMYQHFAEYFARYR